MERVDPVLKRIADRRLTAAVCRVAQCKLALWLLTDGVPMRLDGRPEGSYCTVKVTRSGRLAVYEVLGNGEKRQLRSKSLLAAVSRRLSGALDVVRACRYDVEAVSAELSKALETLAKAKAALRGGNSPLRGGNSPLRGGSSA